ncbi:MAG: Flp pilus assembly protein CpaB [Burkholderiaceae bacterium]|jgi:Flp pilus assembly protein CpaB|nr:Flp pilus assembly protein CpaB [Burkholderiaceae bacterium]
MQSILQSLRDAVYRPRFWIAVFALGLGLAAGWLSYSHLAQAEERLRSEILVSEKLVPVVVAAKPLSPGLILSESLLAIRELPQAWVLPDAVSEQTLDAALGRELVRAVASGAPLSMADLAEPQVAVGYPQARSGYRLLSIPADETSSVSGLIRVGDRVDLWSAATIAPLAVTSPEVQVITHQSQDASHARLLAEALKVVAVGGRYQAQSSSKRLSESSTDRYSSLTLEVPAALVESVLSAQSLGRVVALLRPDPSSLKSGHGHGPGRGRSGAGNAQAKQKPVEVIVHSGSGEAQ